MTSDSFTLHIDLEGATPEEIDRGLTAATAFFAAKRAHPWAAAAAYWKLEGNPSSLTDAEVELTNVWHEAQEVAYRACRPESTEPLTAWILGVVRTPVAS